MQRPWRGRGSGELPQGLGSQSGFSARQLLDRTLSEWPEGRRKLLEATTSSGDAVAISATEKAQATPENDAPIP